MTVGIKSVPDLRMSVAMIRGVEADYLQTIGVGNRSRVPGRTQSTGIGRGRYNRREISARRCADLIKMQMRDANLRLVNGRRKEWSA
jgi:hypothetical protein